MDNIEAKLQALKLTLPMPAVAIASYVPYVIEQQLIFISGQIPIWNGELQYAGAVNENNVKVAQQAAQLCALNIVAQLKAALGNLDKVTRCIRLGGFVNCETGFKAPSQVTNGASDLIVALWGEKGRHARTVVGCSVLPLDAMVEIEAVFAIASQN